MKSLFAVPLLACLCAVGAGFDYQPFGCSRDVSDYIINTDIPRDCTLERKPEEWKAFVDCVTSNGADMSLAVDHCQRGDHGTGPQATEDDAFFAKVCPSEPNQEQFHYHCCFLNHALGFSTNMTWEQYLGIQETCASTTLP